MKPVYLIMSAFGSYADTQKIDFTDVQHGVFLVTGDTGAGKTTIFDAITYALYDKTSGGRRDGNMMRSQYATEDTDTYVEFSFSYQDQIYIIRRNPEYQRLGKRKYADGSPRYVKETAKVSLIMPDGKEFKGKKRETDKKIEEIIGLDVNQFTQIAMIAQGDFLKLLHAESKERKKIFSQIFQTKAYWQIQEELKERTRNLYISLEENLRACRLEMERIELPELEELEISESWEDLLALELPPMQEVLSEAAQIVRLGKQWEKEAEIATEQYQKQSEELQLKIQMQEEVNRIFKDLEKVENEKQALLLQKDEVDKKQKQALDGKRAEKVQVVQNAYLKTQNSLQKNKELIEKVELSLEEENSCLRQEEIKQDEFQKEFDKKASGLQEKIIRLKDLLPRYAMIRKLERDFQQAYEETEKKHQIYFEMNERYESLYQSFFREQAGLLAKDLKEGNPCPVCGSLSHPMKAKLSESAVEQKDVEDAKVLRDKAEKNRTLAVEKLQKVKALADAEKKHFAEILQTDALDITSDAEQRTKEELRILETELKQLQDQCTVQEKKVQALRSVIVENQGKIEGYKQQEKDLKKRLESEREAFDQIWTEQKFKSSKEFENAKQWILLADRLLKEVQEYEQKLVQADTKLQTLQEQTKNRKTVDLQEEKECLKEVLECLKSSKSEWMKRHSVNVKNAEAQKKIKEYESAQSGLREKYERMNNLSRTANGTLSGSVKLDFETYVQRMYFKQIIHAANRRLAKMTSGEFILQCREIENLSSQSQAGLDLDVYHLVSDSVRDVKTLSGGESFMASLAMALGLSDIVQNSSGAIHLDTMFIDEGFGSLDDEARGRAIQILKDLVGEKNLVGIISHVNELKEQIDCKLVVKKTERGSYAKWQIE